MAVPQPLVQGIDPFYLLFTVQHFPLLSVAFSGFGAWIPSLSLLDGKNPREQFAFDFAPSQRKGSFWITPLCNRCYNSGEHQHTCYELKKAIQKEEPT